MFVQAGFGVGGVWRKIARNFPMCEDDNTVREGPQFVEIGADDEGAALGALGDPPKELFVDGGRCRDVDAAGRVGGDKYRRRRLAKRPCDDDFLLISAGKRRGERGEGRRRTGSFRPPKRLGGESPFVEEARRTGEIAVAPEEEVVLDGRIKDEPFRVAVGEDGGDRRRPRRDPPGPPARDPGKNGDELPLPVPLNACNSKDFAATD